ncbi:hypothetical protein FO519_002173 [Halicephalobus sp. NKZ332]|nr:hypothetical protein FO519_002173 [Halicephalobus sp. NKZ332]
MMGKTVPKSVGLLQPQPQEEDNNNIWTEILSEMSSKSNANIQGSVIMLGNDKSGKTSLVNRMCKSEKPFYSSALEYRFLNVQADMKDSSYAYQLGSAGATFGPSDSINLPVHMLAGSQEFVPLLKFAMPKELTKCCFVLMASVVPPEEIIPSLESWYRAVVECIKQHYTQEQIDAGKQAQMRFWKEYVEPLDTSMQIQESGLELDPHLVDLEADVLTENCGAPVVVVLTKCDLYTDLNEDQLNKIQYHLRAFCQARGAALVYTSAKEDKNTHLLYKYLVHRVYGLPFTSSAYIVEKDSIFIPTGWESRQKIDILVESLTSDLSLPASLTDDFSHQNKENTAVEEDEQSFLMRLAALANEPISSSPKRDQTLSKHSQASQSVNQNHAEGPSPIVSFFGNLMKGGKDGGRPSSANMPIVDPHTHFQKILSAKPKKASVSGLVGDQPQKETLTANSSASVLSDQDMDDIGSDNSNVNTEGESGPNSARDQGTEHDDE